ncbi:hypothetical protein PXW79_10725 [Klebsiella variicola]|uniref:hypothetical protein n=1 Tax=Klebsiella variicola TaxID=244366 RepID=UPI002380CF1D|nr:hypothetical protein [Klebsiella variicola]MDE4639779.1 hypothetical protein [Klebsiella variicola]
MNIVGKTMTKSTITRERIEQYANDPRMCNINDEIRELARMALAAMDSEAKEPISFDEWSRKCALQITLCYPDFREKAQYIWDSARETQQPAPEYPEVLPCSVLLEPGLRFGKGIKTSTMLAALARRAVYESDMAALSPEEIAEFQARIEDFKALIAQPAPVVPDAYVRDEGGRMMLNGVCEPKIGFGTGWNACRAAMLQELQKSAGDEVISRSNENVQVLNTIKASPALGSFPKTGEVQNTNPPENPGCWCRACRPVVLNDMRFVVCPDCGNKRCPRANDHRNACTGSNERGQEGSAYPDTLQEPKP